MPPTSQQGSRAGLITAVVIFVILFVTSTIFAIYFNVQWTNDVRTRDQELAKNAKIVSPAQVTAPEVQNLADQAKGSETAMDIALRSIASLTKTIAGSGVTAVTKAQDAADSSVAYAAGKVKETGLPVTVPTDNLAGAVRVLADQLVSVNAEKLKAQEAVKAAQAETQAKVAERDKVAQDKDTQIASLTAEIDKQKGETATYKTAKDTDITGLKDDTDKQLKSAQDASTQLQSEVAKRDVQIAQLNKNMAALLRKLGTQRANTKEAVVRRPAGEIIRIPNANTCFINIGQADSVTPGLTFEVYDKDKGVPPLGDGTAEGDLPVGKASIEVVRVLPNSSECRIIKVQTGATLSQGDLIMNLVFDPHTKYSFLVYGDFDLAQTGNPNPGDSDVMKRLVTQWGGRLVNKVGVDTDFVVLGKEPVLPILSDEDKNNPILVKRQTDAQAALDAYQDVKTQATKLTIPILNQNRFLYYIGYYDQAKK